MLDNVPQLHWQARLVVIDTLYEREREGERGSGGTRESMRHAQASFGKGTCASPSRQRYPALLQCTCALTQTFFSFFFAHLAARCHLAGNDAQRCGHDKDSWPWVGGAYFCWRSLVCFRPACSRLSLPTDPKKSLSVYLWAHAHAIARVGARVGVRVGVRASRRPWRQVPTTTAKARVMQQERVSPVCALRYVFLLYLFRLLHSPHGRTASRMHGALLGSKRQAAVLWRGACYPCLLPLQTPCSKDGEGWPLL